MNRRVLLVGGDKALKQMLVMILESNGFEVTTMSYDLIALEQQQAVDFILLDGWQADSLEIYSSFQANPTTEHIPVIAIVASPDEKNVEKISKWGIRYFLPKPFTENELLLEILTLLVENREKARKPSRH